MKKRWITLLVVIAALVMGSVASADVGDLIRYIPTVITVESDAVTVDGYFVNLNYDCAVGNFTDYEMCVFLDGQLLVDGSFGTINSFAVPPMSAYPQGFTFGGRYGLNNGTYICDDHFYCSFGARFGIAW